MDPAPNLAAFLELHMTEGALSLKDLIAARGYTSVNAERVKLAADNKTLVDTATTIDDAKILDRCEQRGHAYCGWCLSSSPLLGADVSRAAAATARAVGCPRQFSEHTHWRVLYVSHDCGGYQRP